LFPELLFVAAKFFANCLMLSKAKIGVIATREKGHTKPHHSLRQPKSSGYIIVNTKKIVNQT
jgi:protein-arginine kinase activator protein McsA